MAKPTEQQLEQLIQMSDSIQDLDVYVSHQFGPEYVPHARSLAARTNGQRWISGGIHPSLQPKGFSRLKSEATALFRHWPRRFDRVRPQFIIVFSGLLLLVAAVLFPPFELTVQPEVQVHMGFHFLLTAEPGFGRVNTALLCIEVVTLSIFILGLLYLSRGFAVKHDASKSSEA
jgi:hypothetical protein